MSAIQTVSVAARIHWLLGCASWALGVFLLAQSGCAVFGTSCSDGRRSGDTQSDQCTDSTHYITCDGGEGYEYDVLKACPSETPLCVARSTGHQCVSQDQSECVVSLPDISGDQIRASDVNGDGSTDLLYLVGATLTLALASPAGGYALPTPLVAPVSDFRLAQANKDGILDLVALSSAGSLFAIPGAGDGRFPDAGKSELFQGGAYLLGVGDLDGDGVDEVLLQNENQQLTAVSVTERAALATIDWQAQTRLSHALVADTDGDGVAELIASDASRCQVFAQKDGKWALRTSLAGEVLAAADFDGNGLADLVLNQTSSVEVELGRADGSFEAEAPVAGTALAAQDLNGDGNVDLELARSGTLLPLYGRGDGRFEEGAALQISVNGSTALVSTASGTELVFGSYSVSQVKSACLSR